MIGAFLAEFLWTVWQGR